jgi:flavin-binding protein dodecin
MANTTNQGWAKPTIGGSEDTWGQTVNDAIDAIDTLVGSVTAAEVAKLDGLTATTDELNYSAGVTSAIQTQLDAINTVPSGAIMLWSGAADAIPAEYVLCDGTNSTPDLRNRFVVGAGSTYAVGATGGSADAIVVDHTHTGTTSTKSLTGNATYISQTWGDFGTATGVFSKSGGYSQNSTPVQVDISGSGRLSIDASHSHTLNVDSTGSSGTNANLPPYYALCYIMKT